jgi:hypothetical protein
MKGCALFDQKIGASREPGMQAPKIAQRFNAGFRLGESPESLQGRQNRRCLLAVLSSLTGLQDFHGLIFPALKRWAIFGKQDRPCEWAALNQTLAFGGAARRPYQFAAQRDSLRFAS